jgi:UDP-glucose 4-epimerase
MINIYNILYIQIPYKIAGRREGDIASCYANAALAEQELGWTAKLDLSKMCKFFFIFYPFMRFLYIL